MPPVPEIDDEEGHIDDPQEIPQHPEEGEPDDQAVELGQPQIVGEGSQYDPMEGEAADHMEGEDDPMEDENLSPGDMESEEESPGEMEQAE